VLDHATTPETQAQALGALTFKCDMLWAMLDALHFAYVSPALPPPGAFVPSPGERAAA
jgi:pyrroloquinoline quinone (PQQ) biosynthesis protein C